MNSILSKLAGDNSFEVNNNQKYILVIGMTGSGKSSFVNFITGKDNECKVSNSANPCTAEYKIVDCIHYYGSSYKTLNFIDTPGLDDPKGDKNNIEEIIKFRNAFPRINTIIYCQKLDENRFSQSAKILLNLMKDLYPDPNFFKHLVIVRTKSSRKSSDFEDDKKASLDFIKKIKEEYKIDDGLEIKQYYLDSKHRDEDSLFEKESILDFLSKMDPIFMRIKILNIDEVIIFDSLNNRYEIKEKRSIEYTDFDGSTHVNVESESEIQDFNGIKGVVVERRATNECKRCLWCKSWKVVYTIYHKNQKNQSIKSSDFAVWQSKKNEDNSNEIKFREERRLNLI